MTWLMVHLYRRSIVFWLILTGLLAASVLGAYSVMAGAISSHGVQGCLALMSSIDPSAQQEGGSPAGGSCSAGALTTLAQFQTFQRLILLSLVAFPLLLGMFLGAPMVGRELENGTYRLIWVQSVTPLRWMAARLSLGLAFASALLLVVSVATLPWLSLTSTVWQQSPWPGFDMRAVTLVAYGLFAVALGASAATVIGRTVAAIAITGAVWIGTRAAIEILLRPNLIQPLIEKNVTAGTAGSNWFLGVVYVDSAGHLVGWDRVSQIVASGQLQNYGISLAALVQPADRFWTFQFAEAGIYVVLAGLCAAVAVGWVKLRLASA